MRIGILGVYGLCFVLLTTKAFAQDNDTLPLRNRGKDLEEVFIRERHTSKALVDQTLHLHYLKRETLLQTQGNTFMHTLEKLPGISAIQTGVGIAKPVIRGLSLNRVIVNEYGIKQEGQQWGVDHGLEVDQYNVDRVEVIKGPVSVLYGSDGIGGVINILPPIVPVIDTFQAEVITTYKSNNDLLGASAKALYSKGDYYVLARATYQDYASYKVPAQQFTYNGYVLPIYNNRLKNTGGKELNFSLLAGVRKKWGNSSIYLSNYHQKAGFFIGAFGIPRAHQLTDNGDYRSINIPHQLINHTKIISNTNILLTNGKIEVDLGFQKNSRSEISPAHAHGYGPAPQGNEALKLDLYTLSANVRHIYYGSEKWKNIAGVAFQYQNNIRGGYEFLIPTYTSWQAGIYNFIEYRSSEKLLLNGGIRADYGTQNASSTYVSRYDSTGKQIDNVMRSPAIDRTYFNVSGSVGSAWQINKNWNLRANLGRAFRIPVMVELAANGVHHGTFRHEMGDTSIKAEQGYMADLGIHFDMSPVCFQLTPFVNYFTNYIYLSPSARFSPLPDAGQIYQYTGAEALFTGFEFNIDWQITTDFSNNFSAEYVWNKNLNSGLPLPFTPPFSILEELSWKPNISRGIINAPMLTLSGQYFAAQNRVDRNEPKTEGYFLLNFSCANTFKLGQHRLTLFVQLRNITNSIYKNNMSRYRILNLPEQGFNTQVMLRWEF